MRASSEVEEVSQGFALCQERGGKRGGCGLGSGSALHLCLERGFLAKAKGFPLGCPCVGEEASHACSGLLEEGRRSRWRGWKSIGSL